MPILSYQYVSLFEIAHAPKLASIHLVNRKLTNELPYKISSIYQIYGPTVKRLTMYGYSRI